MMINLTMLLGASIAMHAATVHGPIDDGYHGKIVQISDDGYFAVNFKTAPTAVLCANPFKIKEAVAAMRDESWLRSLDCLIVKEGIPVIKIEPDNSSLTEPWKVRVQLPSGGITLWGYAFMFRRPNGDVITY